MAHKITTSLCWAQPFSWLDEVGPAPQPVVLCVAFLDNSGSVNIFQQTPPGGVWWGAKGNTADSPPYQLPKTPVPFTSIAGVNNYLVALGTDGHLYVAVYSQPGGWSAFAGINSNVVGRSAGTTSVSDFSVILPALSRTLLVAVTFTDAGQGISGLYSYGLDLSASPTNVAQATQTNTPWNRVAGQYYKGAYGAAAPALGQFYQGWHPTFALLAVAPAQQNGGPMLACYNSADGENWAQGNLPAGINQLQPTSILVVNGSPNNAIQAVMAINGAPIVLESADGKAWTQYNGNLTSGFQPPVPLFGNGPPGFVGGAGNDGNLQVVGIAKSLLPFQVNQPFLLWQDIQGKWYDYPSALKNGFSNVPPIDAAIGMGWCNAGSALQVCYLGTDGNVYVNWQDPGGNWYWYAGLSGNGLP